MFYDSKTQLIIFTEEQKGAKKVTEAIDRLDEKKLKNIGELVLNFP